MIIYIYIYIYILIICIVLLTANYPELPRCGGRGRGRGGSSCATVAESGPPPSAPGSTTSPSSPATLPAAGKALAAEALVIWNLNWFWKHLKALVIWSSDENHSKMAPKSWELSLLGMYGIEECPIGHWISKSWVTSMCVLPSGQAECQCCRCCKDCTKCRMVWPSWSVTFYRAGRQWEPLFFCSVHFFVMLHMTSHHWIRKYIVYAFLCIYVHI